MIQTVSANDVARLIDEGIDVVDVRDDREWASGHIPAARHIPLEALRENPRAALKRDGILFVCARGMRSLTAAKVAERLGLEKLYSLDGGTSGWMKAGLALVR